MPGQVRTRYATHAQRTAQLLELIGNYLENRNYVDFAALVRHPVLQRMIGKQLPELGDNWLADIDRYYNEVLPRTVEKWVNQQAHGAAAYIKVVELVHAWLEPVLISSRRIDQWTKPLLELFQAAYREQLHDANSYDDERLAWACRNVASAIVALSDILTN